MAQTYPEAPEDEDVSSIRRREYGRITHVVERFRPFLHVVALRGWNRSVRGLARVGCLLVQNDSGAGGMVVVSGLPKNHKKSHRRRLHKPTAISMDRADPTPVTADIFVLVLGRGPRAAACGEWARGWVVVAPEHHVIVVGTARASFEVPVC